MKKTVLEIITFLVLVVVTAVIAQYVNRELERRMDVLKVQAIDLLERESGHIIRYDTISPSIFRFIEVRNVRVHSLEETDAVLLQVNKLRINYSLVRLFASKDPLNALNRVNLTNSQFNLDVRKDREVLALLAALFEQRTLDGELAAPVKLSGANIGLSVTSRSFLLKCTNLFFDIDQSEGVVSVDLRGSVELDLRNGWFADVGLASRLRVNGKFDPGFDWSDMQVQIADLRAKSFALGPQTFQVTHRQSSVTVTKIQDRAPLDLRFVYATDAQSLTFEFDAERFVPASSIQLLGAIGYLNEWMSTSLTAGGRVSYDAQQGGLKYVVSLEAVVEPQAFTPGMEIRTEIAGDETIIDFDPLAVRLDSGQILFRGDLSLGSLLPEGILELTALSLSGSQAVSGAFEIRRLERGLQLVAQECLIGTTEFDLLELGLHPTGHLSQMPDILFDLGASFAGGGHADIVRAAGSVRLESSVRFEAEAQLDNVPLERFVSFLWPQEQYLSSAQPLLSRFTLTTDVSLDTDLTRVLFTAPAVVLTEVGSLTDRIHGTGVVFDGSRLSVERLAGHLRGYDFQGILSAGFDKAEASVDLGLEVRGVPYEVKIRSNGETVRIAGAYGLQGRLETGRSGVEFTLAALDLPVPLEDSVVRTTLDITGAYADAEDWRLSSSSSTLHDVPLFESTKNRLDFAFALKPGTLYLPQIVFEDSYSRLEGNGNVSFSTSDMTSGFGWIVLKGVDSRESYKFSVKLDPSASSSLLSSDIDFERAPLGRFVSSVLTGLITGTAHMAGTLAQPAIDASIVLESGRLNSDPISLQGRFRLSDNEMAAEAVSAAYYSHRLEQGQGRVLLETGEFEFAGRYLVRYLGDDADCILSVEGQSPQFDGTDLTASLFREGMSAAVLLSSIRVGSELFPSWSVNLAGATGRLEFSGGPENGVSGWFAQDGTFELITREPLALTGTARGRIDENSLQATADIQKLDLSVVNEILKTDVFFFTAGAGSGELQVEGPLNDPDYFGSLVFSGIRTTSKLSPVEIGEYATRLVFSGKTITMEEFKTTAGGKPLWALGEFSVDHWLPHAFTLTIGSDDPVGVHVAYQFGPMVIDGHARGIVDMSGDELSVAIEGRLVANNCSITLAYQEIDADLLPSEDYLTANIEVETGKRIEFFWPSFTFPVVRSHANPGSEVLVNYDGHSGNYSVVGSVDVKGGEVFYFDRDFHLKTGTITFGENQDMFDPHLSILAEIREIEYDTGDEVRIFLESDSRFSHFSPQFYSEPSLPDVKILAMVGGSIVNRLKERGAGVSAVMLTTDLVSQFGLLRPLERMVSEFLPVDFFTVRTQVVQNILLEGVLREYNNPLANTTLSLGKYLGTDVFLEVLMRLTTAEGTSVKVLPGIRPEFEVSLEWTTPFFLLEWSFRPEHPENLYLTDNTLAFRWRFLY